MKAPTLVSLGDVIEQTVDIPVGAGGGSGHGGHQGLLPGQCSSPTVGQNVAIPGQGFSSASWSRSLSSSRFLLGAFPSVVFRTFPWSQKCAKVTSRSSAEVGARSSSSTPSATQEGFFVDDAGGVWIRWDTVQWKLLCTDIWRGRAVVTITVTGA